MAASGVLSLLTLHEACKNNMNDTTHLPITGLLLLVNQFCCFSDFKMTN